MCGTNNFAVPVPNTFLKIGPGPEIFLRFRNHNHLANCSIANEYGHGQVEVACVLIWGPDISARKTQTKAPQRNTKFRDRDHGTGPEESVWSRSRRSRGNLVPVPKIKSGPGPGISGPGLRDQSRNRWSRTPLEVTLPINLQI